MCGFAGFCQPDRNFEENKEEAFGILNQMRRALWRRGPDDSGVWLSPHAGLAHARLSIIDPAGGRQPMIKETSHGPAVIAYNGELYNTAQLKKELKEKGWQFATASDTEVILSGYLEWGPDFVKRMNGIFALAIADCARKRLLLARDRAGVKPLFFARRETLFVFASEIKGLFAYPDINPALDHSGLQELFSIGPARIPGSGVFKGISEVLPGHMLLCEGGQIRDLCYWKLESRPHEDSLEETLEKTRFLVRDSIRRQMVSDVPICTFLSGGIDSSLVSAVCAEELKKQGQILHTFSFDFTGNDKNFQANAFQPSQDRPYAKIMAEHLGTCHHFLECSSQVLSDRLFDSVRAHDLPAMADVDASMLHFCSIVKESCKVALTGECADEIFGGYPWFHSSDAFRSPDFPWSKDIKPRQMLLKDEVIRSLDMENFSRQACLDSVARTPRLEGEAPLERRRREIFWLNLNWFMQTLLNRMDRASMYSGLEARVPFADHRIIEYLWNVPWEMKNYGNTPKGLLRHAADGLLPEKVLNRKKSPYPKTHDRVYEKILAGMMKNMMEDSSAPVMRYLDKNKIRTFLESPSDYGRPWYGQLMAGPQLMAYMLQVNFWMKEYHL